MAARWRSSSRSGCWRCRRSGSGPPGPGGPCSTSCSNAFYINKLSRQELTEAIELLQRRVADAQLARLLAGLVLDGHLQPQASGEILLERAGVGVLDGRPG